MVAERLSSAVSVTPRARSRHDAILRNALFVHLIDDEIRVASASTLVLPNAWRWEILTFMHNYFTKPALEEGYLHLQ